MSLESSRREREREREIRVMGWRRLGLVGLKKWSLSFHHTLFITQTLFFHSLKIKFSSPITHHSNSIFSLTQNKTHLVSILNHIFRLFNQTFCQNCGPYPLTLQKTKRPISSSRLQTHLQQSSKLLFFNSPQQNHNLHQKNPQTTIHKNPQTQKTQTQTQESLDQKPKS